MRLASSKINVVGHVPSHPSVPIFLQLGGNIICQVTSNNRRYSADLLQGGLEIPCILIFEGVAKDIAKLDKLVKYAFYLPVQLRLQLVILLLLKVSHLLRRDGLRML